MTLLFQLPDLKQRGATESWRCAGCDTQIRGIEHGLPTFCAFCGVWAQWRPDSDEQEARGLSAWDDDGGQSSTQPRADRGAALQ